MVCAHPNQPFTPTAGPPSAEQVFLLMSTNKPKPKPTPTRAAAHHNPITPLIDTDTDSCSTQLEALHKLLVEVQGVVRYGSFNTTGETAAAQAQPTAKRLCCCCIWQ